ncbi:hypothetical protein ACFQ07_27425, partial [Actinomadura adrarensis]
MSGDPGGLDVFDIDSVEPQVLAEISLFPAAFGVAVRRRFGVPGERTEVIRFIADLRIVLDKDVDDLDPHVTEHWIRGALGQVRPDDREPLYQHLDLVMQATIYVLARLRNQGIVGEGGLERFLEETLELAGRAQDTFLAELAESREDPRRAAPPSWRPGRPWPPRRYGR